MFITFEDDKSVVDTPTEEKREQKFSRLRVSAHGYESNYLVKAFIETETGHTVAGLYAGDGPYARLFAAAPELYEELKASAMAVHTIGHYHSPTCVTFEDCTKDRCVKARAALALVDGPLNQETK